MSVIGVEQFAGHRCYHVRGITRQVLDRGIDPLTGCSFRRVRRITETVD